MRTHLMSKCNAKSKRTGKRCRANAMTGSTKCYHHGGRSKRGIESATFKTGRYSKDLPTRLVARYEAAQLDPNILDQRPEIAVLQARISELLQKIDQREAGQWFRDLQKAKQRFLSAKDKTAAQPHLHHILRMIDQGAEAWMTWEDITRTMEQHRRMVADQNKADQNADLLISIEKLTLIFGTIARLIHEHVPDGPITDGESARRHISSGLSPIFAQLVPGYDRGAAGDA